MQLYEYWAQHRLAIQAAHPSEAFDLVKGL